MFLNEIGLLLKNKREEIGMSQEDIVSKFKIPLRSIRAIEEGDLESLPHEVYTRTFSKGYAEYVGFSPEEIAEMFSEIDDFKNKKDSSKKFESKKIETSVDGGKPRNIKMIIQLLLVALLGASIYFYYAHNGRSETFNLTSLFNLFQSEDLSEKSLVVQKDEASNSQEKINAIENIEVAKDNSNEQVTDSNETLESEVLEGETLASESINKEPLKIDAIQDSIVDNDTILNTVELETATLLDANEVESNRLSVDELTAFIANTPEAIVIDWNILSDVTQSQQQAVIYVSQNCWMEITNDGQVKQFILKEGNQREFIFNDSLVIRLGNASAVTLFHNRKFIEVGSSAALRTVNLKAN